MAEVRQVLLRVAIGSKDLAVIDAVVARNPRAFVAQEEGEDISLRQALSTLIVGGDFNSEYAHLYGYALEQLCHQLGSALGVKYSDAVRSHTLMVTSVEDILEESGSPVSLPRIPDLPTIGHVRPEDMAPTLARVRGQRSLCTDRALLDLFGELEAWLETALSQSKALVFFYY